MGRREAWSSESTGPQRELNIALGVDVVGYAQHHLGDVLHVAVLVHHDDALGEHGLAQRPDGVHHLARVAGVALADGNQHQVVEDAFDGQMNVHDLGDGHLHGGQEDALHGLAHPCVFHGRLADDGGGVDGVLAMRDAGEVEDRVLVGQGVEAGVVAEGAFAAQLAQFDVAFEDDLGVGGDFQIDGLALDDLDRLAAQETGDQELLDLRRRGNDGGKGRGRIGADGHGNFKPRAFQIAHRHLRQAADGTVGDGDRAAGRLGHGRYAGGAGIAHQQPTAAAARRASR